MFFTIILELYLRLNMKEKMALVKSVNTPENLLNEFRETTYSLYQAQEIKII